MLERFFGGVKKDARIDIFRIIASALIYNIYPYIKMFKLYK